MIYSQLGRNDQVVGTGLFGRIGPVVCLTLLLYTDLFKSWFSNSPIEGPSLRLLSLLQDYMWRLLSAYKTKTVINMIIKRNLKNKCIISIPAV